MTKTDPIPAIQWLAKRGFAAVALICVLMDLVGMHNLDKTMCRDTQSNTAWYCTLQDIRCHALPAHCKGEPAQVAINKFHYDQIKPHDPAHMSILGLVWIIALYVVGFAYNGVLFLWYVAKQPIWFNPAIWYYMAFWSVPTAKLLGKLLLIFLRALFNAQAPQTTPQQYLQSQQALGAASIALPYAVHNALIGQGATSPQLRFPD